MIYAVEILNKKFVKIGYSGDDIAFRIAALQTGCPFKINPVFCIDGTLRQEQTLHASLNVAFGRIRVPIPPNEWYVGNIPFFEEFLENLKYGFDFGLGFSEKYNSAIKQGSPKGDLDLKTNFKWPNRMISVKEKEVWHSV